MGLALTEDYEDIKKQSTMAGAGIPDIKMIPDDMEIVYVEARGRMVPSALPAWVKCPLQRRMRRSSTP